MTQDRDGVFRFLMDLGLFDKEDVRSVREAQIGPIVRRLVEKNAIAAFHTLKATELVRKILTEANHKRRLKAQMALMQLITGKMHDRMSRSRNKIRISKDKITSRELPVVPRSLAKAGGG